ncbi:hypothetical protein Tco_0408422 [Tanacetum coccineum]
MSNCTTRVVAFACVIEIWLLKTCLRTSHIALLSAVEILAHLLGLRPVPNISDTEYGCALYESAVRLCMRLLWLTVNRNNATYCASVEDIAVQYCFFDILLTSLSPRNCIPPEVLLRVSMHSACSTSENALEKPLDIRKLDNSSYQALGACFKPYKAFLKR